MMLGARIGLYSSVDEGEPYAGLTFTALADYSTVQLVEDDSISIPYVYLSYSTDNGKNWTPFSGSSPNISLRKGKSVCFKATEGYTNDTLNSAVSGKIYGLHFAMSGRISASGSVMSLIHEDIPDEFPNTSRGSIFARLFYDCTSLVDAPKLPALTMASSCYKEMFFGCTSLVTAPELPATTLANSCYDSMFKDCTSLENAPELTCSTMYDYCYVSMFEGCTSLVKAPELPATTLAGQCYRLMFSGCTSLTEAPKLHVSTMSRYCYDSMFKDCTSLEVAPDLLISTIAAGCCEYMFDGCSSLNSICVVTPIPEAFRANWMRGVASVGSFKYYGKATRDEYGVPDGWTFSIPEEDLTPVEYLESDGSGKINTGVKFGDGVTALKDIGFDMEVVASVTEDSAYSVRRVFGFGRTAAVGYLFRYNFSGTNHLYSSYATSAGNWPDTDQTAIKTPRTIRLVKDAGSALTYRYLDGASQGSQSTTSTSIMHDGVCAEVFGWQYQSDTSTATEPTQAVGARGFRIYSAKIKNTVTGQEVDLIPMRSNVFGVAVMKDLKTGNVLLSEPVDSLIIGPDVIA